MISLQDVIFYILRIMNSNCLTGFKNNQIKQQILETANVTNLENDALQCNLGRMKHLSSSRKLPKTKLHSFGSAKHKKSQPRRLSVKVERLESEKLQLLESISVLKASAIQAIAQKQDQIHRLSETNCVSSELLEQFYRHQLQRCLASHQELEVSHHELEEELKYEREYLQRQLGQRQQRIQELLEIIIKMRKYIDELQENQRQHREKIKYLQRQVEQLSVKINEYSLKLAQVSEEKAEINHDKLFSQSQDNANSQESDLSGQACLPAAVINEKQTDIIKQLKSAHETQINKIIDFYEAKLRQTCFQQCPILQILEPYSPPGQKELVFLENQLCNSYTQLKQQQIFNSEPPYLDLTSQASVHNLREQISPLAQNKDYQSLSQYTKGGYLQPYPFHKQKSFIHFDDNSTKNKIKITQKQTKTTEQNLAEILQNDEQKAIQQKIDLFWEKFQVFSTGFISGASVASLLSIFFDANDNISIISYLYSSNSGQFKVPYQSSGKINQCNFVRVKGTNAVLLSSIAVISLRSPRFIKFRKD